MKINKWSLSAFVTLFLLIAFTLGVAWAEDDYKEKQEILRLEADATRKSIALTSAKWSELDKRCIELIKEINKLKTAKKALEVSNNKGRNYITTLKEKWQYLDDHHTDKPNNDFTLARAVAKAEGGHKTRVGTVLNNPGHVKDPKTGKWKVFATQEEGLQEINNVFGRYLKHNPNITLLQAIKIYAPSSDDNNPYRHATNIAKIGGFSINDKLTNIL